MTTQTTNPTHRSSSRKQAPTPPVVSIEQAKQMLGQVLADLRDGRISARRAKAIAYGISVFAELTLPSMYGVLADELNRLKITAARQGLTPAAASSANGQAGAARQAASGQFGEAGPA
jgi:hypothetical protein